MQLFIKNAHVRNGILFLISVGLLLVGNELRKRNIVLNDFLSVSCSGLILYVGGYLVKTYLPKTAEKWHLGVSIPAVIVSAVVLFFAEKIGHISLGSNAYPSPLFLLGCTGVGIMFLLGAADLLCRVRFVKEAMVYIGQHTMFILFLHFLAFKSVNLLQVLVYRKEWYELAAFPTLEHRYGWWLAYTVAGIGIPLAVQVAWEQLKKKVLKLDGKKVV